MRRESLKITSYFRFAVATLVVVLLAAHLVVAQEKENEPSAGSGADNLGESKQSGSVDYEDLEEIESKDLEQERDEKPLGGQHKKGLSHSKHIRGSTSKDKHQTSSGTSSTKPFDPSKVKLVDLNQWNGAVAKTASPKGSTATGGASTSVVTETATEPITITTTTEPITVAKPPTSKATRRPGSRKGSRHGSRVTATRYKTSTTTTSSTTTTTTEKPASSLSASTESNSSASDSSMTLPTIEVHPSTDTLDPTTKISSDGPADPNLDPRSPAASGKRLSGIIAESKHKLSLHRTPQQASSKFSYSRPNTTTTMMSTVTEATPSQLTTSTSSTPNVSSGSMFIQVINATAPNDLIGFSGGQFENATKNLDWSKLVKVVFKSAKDNHTIYTVVMNSSELNNHPINDWSNELPHLLQRDFEKLIQKWSSVFPVDNLMVDLSKIIVSKVTALPNSGNVSSLLEKLNSTNPNSSSVIQQPELAAKLKPLSQSAISADVSRQNQSTPITFLNGTSPSVVNNATQNQQVVGFVSQMQPVDNSTGQTINASVSPVGLQPSVQQQQQQQTLNATFSSNYLPPATAFSKTYDLNNTMTQAAVRPLNVSTSSATGLGRGTVAGPVNQRIPADNASQASGNGPTSVTPLPSPSLVSHQNIEESHGRGSNKTGSEHDYLYERNHGTHNHSHVPQTNNAMNSTLPPRSLVEAMKIMKNEHIKIDDNVREQASSLRHFIIICSVAVVLATSVLVALILILFKPS